MHYGSLSERVEELPPSNEQDQIEILRRLFYEMEEAIVEHAESYDWVLSGIAKTSHPGWISIVGHHMAADGEALKPRHKDFAESYTYHERAAELLGCWANTYPSALQIVRNLLQDPDRRYLGIFALGECFQCTGGSGVIEAFRKSGFAEIKQVLNDPSLTTGLVIAMLHSVCQKLDDANGNKELEQLAIKHPNYALPLPKN